MRVFRVIRLKIFQTPVSSPVRSLSDSTLKKKKKVFKNVSAEIAEEHRTFTKLYYYSAWVREEMNKFLMYFGTLWIVQILSIVK